MAVLLAFVLAIILLLAFGIKKAAGFKIEKRCWDSVRQHCEK